MAIKSFITGVEGYALTAQEKAFLKSENPWGFILFRRNIKSLPQVANLVSAFRDCVGRENAPVLIDQEGGRVQRIQPPLLPKYPANAIMSALYETHPENARRAVYLHARLIAHDLYGLGISVNCLPLLDQFRPEAHDIIGDRAMGTCPKQISDLAKHCIEGHLDGGLLPIIKHIPGHGRALADSHEELPVVDTPQDDLLKQDCAPFANLSEQPMAMTAHVIYTAWDKKHCATHSKKIIDEIIRSKIGFSGLLMSDDLSMKALEGGFVERTQMALDAGCDMALHCNGHFDEMLDVAKGSRELKGMALARANAALKQLKTPRAFDPMEAREEFASLTGVKVA